MTTTETAAALTPAAAASAAVTLAKLKVAKLMPLSVIETVTATDWACAGGDGDAGAQAVGGTTGV